MTLTTPITRVRPGCGRPGTTTGALTRLTLAPARTWLCPAPVASCSVVPHPPYGPPPRGPRLAPPPPPPPPTGAKGRRYRGRDRRDAAGDRALTVGFIQSRSTSGAPDHGPGAATARLGRPPPPDGAAPPTPVPPPTRHGRPRQRTEPATAQPQPHPKNTIYTIDLGSNPGHAATSTYGHPSPRWQQQPGFLPADPGQVHGQGVLEALGRKGFDLSTPKVKVYKKSIKSPCGRFNQNGAPAYYCSANQTIYWPATRDDGKRRTRSPGSATSAGRPRVRPPPAGATGVREYAQKYYAGRQREEPVTVQPAAGTPGPVLRGGFPARWRGRST